MPNSARLASQLLMSFPSRAELSVSPATPDCNALLLPEMIAASDQGIFVWLLFKDRSLVPPDQLSVLHIRRHF